MSHQRRLTELEDRFFEVDRQLAEELARVWPKGTKVRFHLRYDRKNLSTAIVDGHSGAFLKLRLGRRRLGIHWSRIIDTI